MKILFINTLRLGDTFMSLHVVQSLINHYDDCAVDYLTFDESKQVKNLLSSKVQMYFIDRKKICKEIANLNISLLLPFEILEENIKPLLEKEYDIVINFSNTKISTYLTSMMNGKEYIGSHFNGQGQLNYGSKWFEYLDKELSRVTGSMHFNEIALNALNISYSDVSCLKETASGKIEVKKFFKKQEGKKIILQISTSDRKKDLNEEQIREIIFQLKEKNTSIFIPCMPNEKELIDSKYPGATAVPCSIEGLYSLLSNADGLVSVDTSTKQIASLLDVPIIEISLGGSKPEQTGAFKENVFCIQPKVDCYPCTHSSICNRDYICSKNIDSKELTRVIIDILTANTFPEANTFEVKQSILCGNFYYLVNPNQPSSFERMAKLNLYKYLNRENFKLTHELRKKIKFHISDSLKTDISMYRIYLENLLLKVGVNKTVSDIFSSVEFENIEKIASVLSIPKYLVEPLVLPANQRLGFAGVRYVQNFIKNNLDYVQGLRNLILNMDSEEMYEKRE